MQDIIFSATGGRTIANARFSGRRLVSLILIASTSVIAQTRDADVDAVRQCVTTIQQGQGCQSWVSVQAVRQIDRRIVESQGTATVIAEIDLKVLQTFDGNMSEVTGKCTGTGWKMDPSRSVQMFGGLGFPVGQGLRVQKEFEFHKFDSGWRCATTNMRPISKGNFVDIVPTTQQGGAEVSSSRPKPSISDQEVLKKIKEVLATDPLFSGIDFVITVEGGRVLFWTNGSTDRKKLGSAIELIVSKKIPGAKIFGIRP